MKKKIALLLVTSMSIGMLAGCGNSNSDNASDTAATEETASETATSETEEKTADTENNEPITVDFWNSWTGSDGDTLVEEVNQFNENNPWNITINMDISSSFAEKLSTSLPTGEAAPLVLLGAGDRFKYQDYLLDIDDIWENTDLKEDDFNPNTMGAMKIDDKLYGIPFQNSMYYMYWNKDLFTEAGLDPETPPSNFDEWTEMAHKITNADKNIYGSGLYMSYGNQEMCLMQQKAGWLVNKTDDGKWSVDVVGNDGVKEYLTWMKNIYDQGDNPVDNEIDSMFNAGQIGILVNGPWLAAGADEAGINYGMTKIFGQEPVGDVAGFFITSSATSEQKLACERFIQWWHTGNDGSALEDTGVGQWSLKIGFPTAYLPLEETSAYKNDDKLQALSLDDNSNESIWITTDPDFQGWADAIGAVGTMTESVVYDTSIDEAMQTAQETLEAAVKTYYGDDALAAK